MSTFVMFEEGDSLRSLLLLRIIHIPGTASACEKRPSQEKTSSSLNPNLVSHSCTEHYGFFISFSSACSSIVVTSWWSPLQPSPHAVAGTLQYLIHWQQYVKTRQLL